MVFSAMVPSALVSNSPQWSSPQLPQAHPIHLWDACTGSLRCVYRAYDAADEITSAYSVAINRQGSRLWAGYNKCIRVFDLSRPGRDYQTITTFQKGQDGQPGMHCRHLPLCIWILIGVLCVASVACDICVMSGNTPVPWRAPACAWLPET